MSDAFEEMMKVAFPEGMADEERHHAGCTHTPAQHSALLVIGALHGIFSVGATTVMVAAKMDSPSLDAFLREPDSDFLAYMKDHWEDTTEEYARTTYEWAVALCNNLTQYLHARALRAFRIWCTTPDGWLMFRCEDDGRGWMVFMQPPRIVDDDE